MRIWVYNVERACETRKECLATQAWIYMVEVSPEQKSVEVAGTREAGFNGITCEEEVARRNHAIYEAAYATLIHETVR